MARRIADREHERNRGTLRVVGPAILIVGIVFLIVGMGSFFSSFGTAGPPRYFWCCFVGVPLIGIGAAICKFAFLGSVSRYVAGEVAPVGKDVVNYMADETKDAVRKVASAVGEGLRSGQARPKSRALPCQECNEGNEDDAKFCKACGASLAQSIACPSCAEPNDPDARFCDHCGEGIG